jgi:ferredoxin-NADP reductase
VHASRDVDDGDVVGAVRIAGPVMTSPAPTPTGWQSAIVTVVRREAADACTFGLRPMRRIDHAAGQLVAMRRRGADGTDATTWAPITSVPDRRGGLEVTAARDDGDGVGACLQDSVAVGQKVEVRGPLGAFWWDGRERAVVVVEGVAVRRVIAMLRLARTHRLDRIRTVVVVGGANELCFVAELMGDDVRLVPRRPHPAADLGRAVAELVQGALAAGEAPLGYACGSGPFLDAVVPLLLAHGIPAARVRRQRHPGP